MIAETLLDRDEWKRAKTICTYVSLPDEVDTGELLVTAFDQGKIVVVPRVDGEQLKLYRIDTLGDLQKGYAGIQEPKISCRQVSKFSVDLFIVPGRSFDRMAMRRGRGKGYYDRLLKGVTATKIGLAYPKQIVPRLPRKKYDIPMDVVISENETITP